MAGRAEGVPLELELTVVAGRRLRRRCPGHAIYLWQNDAAGAYSLYDLPDANYLRGLQAADAQGRVRFTAIVPGCYGGRYPHCHFEVFESTEAALARRARRCWSRSSPSPTPNAARSTATTRATARACAISSGSRSTRDFVFGDTEAAASQLVAMTGDPASGYRGTATIALA